jgi:hypothetical protein
MCPTPVGRLHTRVATLVLPALLGLALTLITGKEGFIVLIGVLLMLGVTLDTAIYPWLLRYQPPWMTFVLGLGEFGLLYALANALELGLEPWEAIVFYWVSWLLAVFTKVVLLPILSLTYLESSLEFRRAAWSIPPVQANVPILASAADAQAGPGRLIEEASGVHQRPLERKPGLSGVH